MRIAFVLIALFALTTTYADDHNAVSPRAVLVTGASSGIGQRIATTLAEQGFYVYAGARKARDIEALSAHPRVEGIRLDVTRQEEIDAAVATIRERGRGLYGLVNNAGVFLFDPLIEVSEADMQFIMDVNVMGPYRVTKAFAPLIIASEGRITSTGSVAGLFSAALFGPYGMSKHAMEAYTDALAGEMAKFDVDVSIVEPGNFRSNIMKNMHRRLEQLDRGERTSAFREEIARFASFTQQDRSHHADPQPVADAVLDFLTAEDPKMRYLVVPNEREATLAISRSLAKVLELNGDHRFAKTRDELVTILDDLLDAKAVIR
ncbi:MAG: SDR family oxidoreductase [Pseudomonadota bacterium]